MLKIPLKKSHTGLDYHSKVGRNILYLHWKTCDIFSMSSKVVSSKITLTTNMWETKRDLEQKKLYLFIYFFFIFIFFWETSKRFFELSGNFKRYLLRFDLHITILATIIINKFCFGVHLCFFMIMTRTLVQLENKKGRT